MYPPPPKETIDQLHGNVVRLVSFGKYVVHIGFENGDRLSIGSHIHTSKSNYSTKMSPCEFPLSHSRLMRLLAFDVDSVNCKPDGTLVLIFSNVDLLVVFAHDSAYEAYTLTIGGKEFVV